MTNAGTLPKGVTPTPSVGNTLRAAFRKTQGNKTKDVSIPGFSGQLHVVFRALDDYTEVRDGIKDIIEKHGIPESAREIEIGIATLLLSAIESYAVIEDEKVPCPPLGLELYDFIFPAEEEEGKATEARPDTDAQAVFMLFPGTMPLMVTVGELDQWFKSSGAETEETVLGE
jgi:hypothetical protein